MNSFCRPIIMEHGIWDQVRVDHGREWCLMLHVQEVLAKYRRDASKPPHRQTSSKLVINCNSLIVYLCILTSLLIQNHTVERFWPEINCRVNYPVKACLVDMEEKGDFNIDDELKFCACLLVYTASDQGWHFDGSGLLEQSL